MQRLLRRKELNAKVLTVRLPKREIGLFNSLIDGAGRLAIARTRDNHEGVVDLIATPYCFDKLIDIVEGIKKHIPELEILGVSSFSETSF
jgi:hypothetical protein